jgi:peptide-methionine (S)-S-oxide reductase
VFQEIKGVLKVESGYSGGAVVNPTYKQVCTGNTGHAEVIQITFDPAVVSYDKLLEAFFYSHDPTTLNRQGNDVGTQYRSAVFYHSEAQKTDALALKEQLDKAKVWPDPIVTEVTPFKIFYKAEDYHQNYYNDNGAQPYCQFVIKPKVDKFKKAFAQYLKEKK